MSAFTRWVDGETAVPLIKKYDNLLVVHAVMSNTCLSIGNICTFKYDTAVSLNRDGQYGIPVPDYIEENVSTKVVKIIQSYTGIVNKMVWRKS